MENFHEFPINCSKNNEVFYCQRNFLHKNLLDQKNFQKARFSAKLFFLDQVSFTQTKILTQSKKFSANKDQKGSLKAKILDPFNTKLHAKIFLTL